MYMISDIVLNFTKEEECYECFEWSREDVILEIDEIPLVRISDIQMREILSFHIQLEKSFFHEIKNHTKDHFHHSYHCLLITDGSIIMALEFDENGQSKNRSCLLADEEKAVLEETQDLDLFLLPYQKMNSFSKKSFLTRKEKETQKYLLNEIHSLYQKREYEELRYFYFEFFQEPKNIYSIYQKLIDEIGNHYSEKYEKIVDIIGLISEGKSLSF